MSVSRRFARAGVAVLALSAGALGAALLSNPHLLRQGLAGEPDVGNHPADTQNTAPSSAGLSNAGTDSPPVAIASGGALDETRGGIRAGRSAARLEALGAASTEGLTPGPAAFLGGAGNVPLDAMAEPGGGEAGAEGSGTPARSQSFAAVSMHRLGNSGADETDLPDEPTSAGVAAVAAGAPGGAGGSLNGTGGLFGNAAVGSFAFATAAAPSTGVEGRAAQVPAGSAEIPVAAGALASVVPEPESAVMLLAGLLVLSVVARRRAEL